MMSSQQSFHASDHIREIENNNEANSLTVLEDFNK